MINSPDYNGHPNPNHDLTKGAGGRVLALIKWKHAGKDFLVEMNLSPKNSHGTESLLTGIETWGNEGEGNQGCLSDTSNFHRSADRTYVILSSSYFIKRIIPKFEDTIVGINWGRVLRTLAQRPPSHPCHIPLNAVMHPTVNSFSIGVAQEVKGRMRQRVRYSRSKVYQFQ